MVLCRCTSIMWLGWMVSYIRTDDDDDDDDGDGVKLQDGGWLEPPGTAGSLRRIIQLILSESFKKWDSRHLCVFYTRCQLFTWMTAVYIIVTDISLKFFNVNWCDMQSLLWNGRRTRRIVLLFLWKSYWGGSIVSVSSVLIKTFVFQYFVCCSTSLS